MARWVELRVLIDLDQPLGPQVAPAKAFLEWKLLEDMTGKSRQHLHSLIAGTKRWASGVVTLRRLDGYVNDSPPSDA
jgi:hypothetical protein